MKKKILGGALLVTAIVGAVILSIMFKDTSQYNVALREESIIVSINPEVLFNTDNKGYVKEILHINEDAKIYKEDDFLGLEIKEAVNKTVEIAKEHGYVKEDTVVNVSSLSENSVYVEDIVLNLKGNKINIKTKKLSKEAIETIMSNIDTTGNVETEFIVLDDDYVIIKKKSDIKGPGPSEEELNNQTENNTKPVEKAYLNFGDLYSMERVKEIEKKYNIKINLVADAKCGYIEGGDLPLIESGKKYIVHINSIDPYVQGACGDSNNNSNSNTNTSNDNNTNNNANNSNDNNNTNNNANNNKKCRLDDFSINSGNTGYPFNYADYGLHSNLEEAVARGEATTYIMCPGITVENAYIYGDYETVNTTVFGYSQELLLNNCINYKKSIGYQVDDNCNVTIPSVCYELENTFCENGFSYTMIDGVKTICFTTCP